MCRKPHQKFNKRKHSDPKKRINAKSWNLAVECAPKPNWYEDKALK